MFKFLNALFKKQKEELEELKKEQEEQVEKVEIIVNGDYTLQVVDSRKEPQMNGIGYYDRYVAKLTYKVNVKIGENHFNIDSHLGIKSYHNEENAYLDILKLLEKGEEKLLGKIKDDIIYKLRVAIRNKNIKEMKKILEDKNNFKLNFTFEAEKSLFDKN